MEEKDKIEDVVKELIYEQALREKLQKSEIRKRNYLYLISSIAATLLLVVGYFLITTLSNSAIDRNTLVAQNYEFPTMAKSRSSETNIVDDFIEDLNIKKYKEVLTALNRDSLSEKDLFVKANLLFVLDSLNASKVLTGNTTWTDNYHAYQTTWLSFLIEIRLGKSKNDLITLSKSLPSSFKQQANNIIDQLED